MDNGLQPHTGEQSPIQGRKGGANGGLVIKKSESRTESRSDFFSPNKQFSRPCLDNYSIRKESELKFNFAKWICKPNVDNFEVFFVFRLFDFNIIRS